MPWVQTREQFEEADVARAADKIRGNREGPLPPMHAILSLRPRLMLAMDRFRVDSYNASSDSGLTRLQLDMIAAVVATSLRCRHCAVNHAERAVIERDDLELARELKANYREARLTPKELAMLEYAELLTVDPTNVHDGDIVALRDAGWTDADIVDIVHQTALLNYQARLANGLGLEPGPEVLRIEERDRAVIDTGAWGSEPLR